MRVTGHGLVKRFSDNSAPAVSGVDFVAPAGRITALLGPSGSGKSTLLRLIAGLERPDAGSVRIGDRDCTVVPARERGVGFVFQSYALFEHMSVFDNVAFGLAVRKHARTRIEARVRELLALVQLEGYEQRSPRQLSGGQRQRVALARALAPGPQVLLLDEPFGALDAKVRVELRQWLQVLQAETAVTTILVTHDQEEALELSQHVVLLHQGEVVQAGEPHELYDHPCSPFVATFLGGASRLGGRVDRGRVDLGDGSLLDAVEAMADGSQVGVYVRPHDVTIFARNADGDPRVTARVERLVRVGGHVKLSLTLGDGTPLQVELGKDEVDDLGLSPGDHVGVDLKRTKVFVEDYSI